MYNSCIRGVTHRRVTSVDCHEVTVNIGRGGLFLCPKTKCNDRYD